MKAVKNAVLLLQDAWLAELSHHPDAKFSEHTLSAFPAREELLKQWCAPTAD